VPGLPRGARRVGGRHAAAVFGVASGTCTRGRSCLGAKEQRIEDNTPTPLWDHVDLVLPLDAIAPTLIALATAKSLGSDGATAAAAQSTP